MKKIILPLLSIFVLFSCSNDDNQPEAPAPSPLVITKADYETNYKVGGATFNFFRAENSAVTIPVAGENQTWDFSALTEISSTVNGGAQFLTPSNEAFPTATYSYLVDDYTYNISGVASNTYVATFFNELNDNGIYSLGYSQSDPVSINVAAIGATISYAAQDNNYTGVTKFPVVVFPATFGSAAVTTSGIVNTSSFTVTAPAFGLNNTPGQTKVTTEITQEVIASGKANFKGIGEKRVLVLKSTYSDTSNYFLGGAPAPAILLSTLGVTDGATISSTTYRFIAEGLGSVGIIDVNAEGAITAASFRKG